MPAIAIAAVATVGSAVISSNATNKAVKAQTNATNSANAQQQAQYDQTRKDNAPWQSVGTEAIGQLAKLYGIQTKDVNGKVTGGASTAGVSDMSGFTTSPDYQYTLDQGNKNLNTGYAAKGALDSGAAQKALVRFGQNEASKQYDSYFTKLATLAGYGQQANAANTQAGQTATNAISNNTIALGNNKASSYLSQGQNMNSALGSLTSVLSNYSAGKSVKPSMTNQTSTWI